MDKILPIWKPVGPTSFDIIRNIKQFNKNIKIGHCGTLDPFAEGILILCTGNMTKKVASIVNLSKKYRAKLIFGFETDTLDNTGTLIKSNNKKINKKEIKDSIKKFVGNILQSPPPFSAVKFRSVKLYTLARKDIFLKLNPRTVRIESIKIISIRGNTVNLEIVSHKGTYIRSLARDLAYSMDTYSYVDKLVRVSVGEYNREKCIDINKVAECLN